MNKHPIFHKVYVTLLEMLLVLAILALVGGALAYNINNAVIDQRFRTEVSRVVDELRLAQDLMLILKTDVHLKFAKDEKDSGIKYWLELETPLSKPWENEIKRPLKNLKVIRGVFLNDLNSPNFTKGQIDVRFLSRGSLMSRGIMRLATTTDDDPPPGTLNSYICLPGYPHPILSNDRPDADKACIVKDEVEQNQRLTLSTVEKIPEQVKKAQEKPEEKKVETEKEAPPTQAAILPAPKQAE